MLDSYQKQTCSIEPLTGTDKFGAETFGAAAAHACRWERQQALVRAADGDKMVLTAGELLLPTGAVANVGDRVTVDGGVYRVFTAAEVRGLFGALEGRKAVLR